MLIAVTFKKGRCGFERDGSYSTKKEDRWQMFDVGVASQTLCLAAHEAGLGTVIMGIWDEDGITDLLHIPEDQDLLLSSPSDILILILMHLKRRF